MDMADPVTEREEIDEPVDCPRRRLHLRGPIRTAAGAEDGGGVSQGDAVREPGDPCPLERRGGLDFGVGYENHTSYPAPGQIILYPGGISETEILLAYGGVHFASKMGQLAGNHFITLTSGLENLAAFGKTVLWKGAQKIRFEEA
jgi:hypothetical protein